MKSVIRDIQYGIRVLIKNPGFTLVAIITLALGIGANTAIFSIINATLLRDLPYQNPEQIVVLWGRNPQLNLNQSDFPTSYPDFIDWRNQNKTFSSLAAVTPGSFNLSSESIPERVGGVGVSADFFKVIGVNATLGRTFVQQDEDSKERSVILSYGIWQRRFGGEKNVVGKSMTLDGNPYQIVGVMPEGFNFPRGVEIQANGLDEQTDIWTPLSLQDYEVRERGNRVLIVFGRLKPDMSVQQAQADMSAITGTLENQYQGTNRGFSVEVVPIYEQLVSKTKPGLLMLFVAVGLVLVIACVNVANLILVRASTRQKEIAVRVALGASRWQIIRQLLTESLLIALLGGAVGLLISVWLRSLLISISPLNISSVDINASDYRVLGFTFLLSLLTPLFFGLLPALRVANPQLNTALKDGERTMKDSGQKLRMTLIVAEIALTLIVLVGMGLLIRSFMQLQKVDTGINSRNILTMKINLPLEQYKKRQQWNDTFKQIVERVESIPGVEAAATTFNLPVSGTEGSVGFQIEGRANDPNTKTWAGIRRVSPSFFDTMGITLLRGRHFTEQDLQNQNVIIINQAMADRFWNGMDPVGQRLQVFGRTSEIIGIVNDVKYASLDSETDAEFYQPTNLWYMNLVVRTSVEPTSVLSAIQTQVSAVDKNLPLAKVSKMDKLISESAAGHRFRMFLISLFGFTSLIMAMVGIYGVISYSVSQRTQEIGIRMALGAMPKDVLKLILRKGVSFSLVGISIGLAGSFFISRLMKSLLFGVSPTNFLTYLMVSAVLLVMAMLACYIPARRAARVNPLTALKHE